MKKYELIGRKNGCLYSVIEPTSYKKAYDYFKTKYIGDYKILCYLENGTYKTINVRFQ